MVSGTHSMFAFLEVNGLATDASALDNEIPEFAKMELIKNSDTVKSKLIKLVSLPALSAPQSFLRIKNKN